MPASNALMNIRAKEQDVAVVINLLDKNTGKKAK